MLWWSSIYPSSPMHHACRKYLYAGCPMFRRYAHIVNKILFLKIRKKIHGVYIMWSYRRCACLEEEALWLEPSRSLFREERKLILVVWTQESHCRFSGQYVFHRIGIPHPPTPPCGWWGLFQAPRLPGGGRILSPDTRPDAPRQPVASASARQKLCVK